MNIKELIDRNGGEAIAFGEGWKTHKCGKCLGLLPNAKTPSLTRSS